MKPGDVFLCYIDRGPERGCYHVYRVKDWPNGTLTPVAFITHTCSQHPTISYSKKLDWYEERGLIVWAEPSPSSTTI